MKINENGRIQPLQAYQKNAVPLKSNRDAKVKSQDELTISPEALEMMRGGRVEEIKQSIENGAYQVDAHKIAEKIVRNLLGE